MAGRYEPVEGGASVNAWPKFDRNSMRLESVGRVDTVFRKLAD